MLKVLFKDTFISPRPQVPINYHENRLPLIPVSSSHLVIQIIKDPVPTIQRKKT
jgi:hypothetical protein